MFAGSASSAVAGIARQTEALTVDVAEPAGLCLLGVMKTAGPIDRNVALVARQPRGALCPPRCQCCGRAYALRVRERRGGLPMEPPAEIEQYSKSPSKIGQSSAVLTARASRQPALSRAETQVPATPTSAHLPCQSGNLGSAGPLCGLLDEVRSDAREKVDVFVRVELGHLFAGRRFGALRATGRVNQPSRSPLDGQCRRSPASGAVVGRTKISIFL